MGQDQKGLAADGLYADVGHHFGLDHAVYAGNVILKTARHLGAHGLWAQHRNLDAGVAVAHCQPFRQSHGGVFAHPIGRIADLIKQPCGRGGIEQIPVPPRRHPRQQMARRPDMRHDVDLPGSLPVIIGHLDAAANTDAGI